MVSEQLQSFLSVTLLIAFIKMALGNGFVFVHVHVVSTLCASRTHSEANFKSLSVHNMFVYTVKW